MVKIILDKSGGLWYSKQALKIVPSGWGKFHIAEWSSPVARWAHNPKVVGSNPASATKSKVIL